MNNLLKSLITLATLITMLVGALTYFATADDLDQVAMRLDQSIKMDRIESYHSRMWDLKARYIRQGSNQVSYDIPIHQWRPEDRKEYEKLQHKLEQLEKDSL